ncbi:uncharacterized protein IUM83_17491 [Phytophthora cinnamomi]|uniref:uncharacterized protein n=1 Tax=Phytophthora cinnamomi TaxID=4785 RepID=UPI003559E14F|nr:hypothetical protein IUM83_17491 [Phytophthora cinnamomi]
MLQRRRRRLTQRRYRKKKEDKASSLAKEVDLLREGVRELKKKIIASPPPEEAKTPWSLVVRYFSLFRFGFNVHELGDVTSSSLVEVHVQKKFLLETMASDVASNGGIGLQSMLYEWRNLSLRHTNLEIALVKLDRHSNGVIIADIKLYTTITASMLRNAFADSDAADGEYNRPEFAWKLLGQRLVFLGGVRFEWDETKCQFASVLYEVDMLSPLLKFLADVEEAALVMDSALGILPMKVDTD